MMKQFINILLTCSICLFMACGDDTPDKDKPMLTPPVQPEKPASPKALYNGIRLPDQWPPVRSATAEIRKGMSPFYLSSKPPVINIAVGRQLFVDNFLVESTTLKRTFYYPEYFSGNPVLAPDKDWEKMGTKGAAFAAPFSDGLWYDEQDGKFKMWYMAGGGTHRLDSFGVTCYAESTDGINWTKPTLAVVPGTNIVDYNSERDASVVWIDKQETKASKRYKMFLVAGGKGNWKYNYKPEFGIRN